MFNLAALGAITFFYTGDRQADVWIPLFLLSEEMSLFSCGVEMSLERHFGPSCDPQVLPM